MHNVTVQKIVANDDKHWQFCVDKMHIHRKLKLEVGCVEDLKYVVGLASRFLKFHSGTHGIFK